MSESTSKKILVAPLNWGLGHATRCIPIIEKLVEAGHSVYIGTDGDASLVLKNRFPKLIHYSFASLEIKYYKWFFIGLIFQMYKLVKWYYNDRKLFKKIQAAHDFDVILSDCRPGVYEKNKFSILVISQPNPIVPWYFVPIVIKSILNLFIKRYNELWLPDVSGEMNLSGKLIHISSHVKHRFIGFCSAISPRRLNESNTAKILAIVSGPEPFRTNFINDLVHKLPDENVLIIGGKPQGYHETNKFKSYLKSDDLATEIASADVIISRGGYSSLMDFAGFNKKLILVPTPGQTEQEYLATRLVTNNQAIIWDINLEEWPSVKEKIKSVLPFYLANDTTLLPRAIQSVNDLKFT